VVGSETEAHYTPSNQGEHCPRKPPHAEWGGGKEEVTPRSPDGRDAPSAPYVRQFSVLSRTSGPHAERKLGISPKPKPVLWSARRPRHTTHPATKVNIAQGSHHTQSEVEAKRRSHPGRRTVETHRRLPLLDSFQSCPGLADHRLERKDVFGFHRKTTEWLQI